jgi:hypothetical protein
MKLFLLTSFLLISAIAATAQSDKVITLTAGTYAIQSGNDANWSHGSIVLIDDSHYKTSNETIIGDYRFSATAQRILFLSGSLKGVFARTAINAGAVAIILPLKENVELGFKMANTDVVAYYKKN